jgi:hypothetical protein
MEGRARAMLKQAKRARDKSTMAQVEEQLLQEQTHMRARHKTEEEAFASDANVDADKPVVDVEVKEAEGDELKQREEESIQRKRAKANKKRVRETHSRA